MPALKPTVKIISDSRPDLGYVIINREDFDPNKHLIWEDDKQASHQIDRPAKRKQSESTPEQLTEVATTPPANSGGFGKQRKQPEPPPEEG